MRNYLKSLCYFRNIFGHFYHHLQQVIHVEPKSSKVKPKSFKVKPNISQVIPQVSQVKSKLSKVRPRLYQDSNTHHYYHKASQKLTVSLSVSPQTDHWACFAAKKFRLIIYWGRRMIKLLTSKSCVEQRVVVLF